MEEKIKIFVPNLDIKLRRPMKNLENNCNIIRVKISPITQLSGVCELSPAILEIIANKEILKEIASIWLGSCLVKKTIDNITSIGAGIARIYLVSKPILNRSAALCLMLYKKFQQSNSSSMSINAYRCIDIRTIDDIGKINFPIIDSIEEEPSGDFPKAHCFIITLNDEEFKIIIY